MKVRKYTLTGEVIVDEGNKINVIKNLQTKIEKLITREEQREALKEKLWAQLEKNCY
jgi:hypothetical protein